MDRGAYPGPLVRQLSHWEIHCVTVTHAARPKLTQYSLLGEP